MKGLIMIIAYIAYAWYAINMLIDIEDFGDFLWFITIGAAILWVIQVLLAGLLVLLFGDD